MAIEAAEDMEFELLFDDERVGGSCQCDDDDTYTCMHMRVLRRLLASSSDSLTRQVAASVTATVAGCSGNGREELLTETFRALSADGHKVYLCKAPGSGLPGQLCFTHTYLALQRDNPDGSVDMLLIEPTLRDEFHVVRPQRWYTQLIETLPNLFIGPPRQLAALIDFMAVRMEESFRACGMTSPPWRQKASLLARWELTQRASAWRTQLPPATFSSASASSNPLASAGSTLVNTVLFNPSPTAVSPAAAEQHDAPTSPTSTRTTAPVESSPMQTSPSASSSPQSSALEKQQRRVALATLLRASIAHNRSLHPRAKPLPSATAAGGPANAVALTSVRLLSRGVVKPKANLVAREGAVRALKFVRCV